MDIDLQIHEELISMRALLVRLIDQEIDPTALLDGKAELQVALAIHQKEEERVNTIILAE